MVIKAWLVSLLSGTKKTLTHTVIWRNDWRQRKFFTIFISKKRFIRSGKNHSKFPPNLGDGGWKRGKHLSKLNKLDELFVLGNFHKTLSLFVVYFEAVSRKLSSSWTRQKKWKMVFWKTSFDFNYALNCPLWITAERKCLRKFQFADDYCKKNERFMQVLFCKIQIS